MLRPKPYGRRRNIVAWVRRRFDALDFAVRRRPWLSRLVGRVRSAMRWFARRFLSRAVQPPELGQARGVMANAPRQPTSGPKVLFVTFRAMKPFVARDVTIAQALRLRGARCEFFFCGGGLPICEMGWPAEDDATVGLCESCGSYVADMIDTAGFPRRSLGELVGDDERGAVENEVRAASCRDAPASFRGRALDPLVEQSLVRFFRTGTLPDTDEVARARDDFRVGAAIMSIAAPRLIDAASPDVIVLINGIFYEDRILREEARTRGVRVVSYEFGTQTGTLFFSDGAPAANYDISDLWERESDRPLGDDTVRELEALLRARRDGSVLLQRYYSRPRGLTTRDGTPTAAVFTNVSWDTAVTGKSLAFDSMFDWIAETIRIAASHPEIDFVIRAHPAESRVPGEASRELVTEFIERNFSSLPGNVRLVGSEEALDSYALIDAADVVAVYTSTIGLEAAAHGKPVCVAGQAHYRGRGFTTDITSADDYQALFNDLSWALPDPERHTLARRYAHLFFCRAMLPFPAVGGSLSEPVFNYASVAELGPGRDRYLDLICDGILEHEVPRLPAT